MYQKFIITGEGHLRFGQVYLHRELLKHGEQCVYGGGLWSIDESRGAIILYGRSFDFGPPDFDYVRVIEWDSLGNSDGLCIDSPCMLFYQPHWPNDETLFPINNYYLCPHERT